MDQPFSHYLITRYNVRLENWEKDARGQATLDEAWMNHRYELFSKYCFPSVIAQSVKDFTWLIYIESTTTELQLRQLQQLTEPHDFIQIRLVRGYAGCMGDIDIVLTNADTPYVITSRLDNDDGYGRDYVKVVQEHFVPLDKTMINLLHGYGYMPEKKIATRLHHLERNSFCSFIERRRPEGGHITVRGFQHGRPPEGTEIINVDIGGMWLKIFHERNLLSKPFGYPVLTNTFSRYYGIKPSYLALRISSTLRYCPAWALDGIRRKLSTIFRPAGGNA